MMAMTKMTSRWGMLASIVAFVLAASVAVVACDETGPSPRGVHPEAEASAEEEEVLGDAATAGDATSDAEQDAPSAGDAAIDAPRDATGGSDARDAGGGEASDASGG